MSKPAGAGAELTEDELLDQAIAANKAAADAGVRPLTRTELIAKLDQVMLLHVAAYADTYVPGPPYCTYGLRVPASCVLCAPKAQDSLPGGGGGHDCTDAVHVPAKRAGAPSQPTLPTLHAAPRSGLRNWRRSVC